MFSSRSRGQASLAAVASLGALAACGNDLPTPTTIDALSAPESGVLVDSQVILDAHAEFVGKIDASYFYQPPPSIVMVGRTPVTVEREGYMVEDTDFSYNLTFTGESESFVVEDVIFDDFVPGGDIKVIAVFEGLDSDKQPIISSFEPFD